MLNHWHLHVIVDDDKLLRPLTDGVDVKVESEVSDQSPGVRNRAVDLMRTGISEKSRTDFMKLNYYCAVVVVVFAQPVKLADEEFGRGCSLHSTAQLYAHKVVTSHHMHSIVRENILRKRNCSPGVSDKTDTLQVSQAQQVLLL